MPHLASPFPRPPLAALLVAMAGFVVPAARVDASRDQLFQRAQRLFQLRNYRAAAPHLAAVVESAAPHEPRYWRAARMHAVSLIASGELEAAARSLDGAARRARGTSHEAHIRRFLGLYHLSWPHFGTVRDGVLARGDLGQGTYVETYHRDWRRSVQELESARRLYRAPTDVVDAASWFRERIECQFDLIHALTRFGPYDPTWHNRWSAWDASPGPTGDRDWDPPRDALDGGIGPAGIPVDSGGRPRLPGIGREDDPDADPESRIRYLLAEIEVLCRERDPETAALAVHRSAMLSRVRYGPEQLDRLSWLWDAGGRQPFRMAVDRWRPGTLDDDQSWCLVGREIRKVRLPQHLDPIHLLERIGTTYPRVSLVPEALYGLAHYLESTRRVARALATYESLIARHPGSGRAQDARQDILRLRSPAASIPRHVVSPPGAPVILRLRHRNSRKVLLVAWEIDLDRLVTDITRELQTGRPSARRFPGVFEPTRLLGSDPGDPRPPFHECRASHSLQWEVEFPGAPEGLDQEHPVEIGLERPGWYVLEVFAAADRQRPLSRGLIRIPSLALVEMAERERIRWFVADPVTGSPAGGVALEHLLFWKRQPPGDRANRFPPRWMSRPVSSRTDASGLAGFELDRDVGPHPRLLTVARPAGGPPALLATRPLLSAPRRLPGPSRPLPAGMTDRDRYVPGDTVHVALWLPPEDARPDGSSGGAGKRAFRIEDPAGRAVLEFPAGTDAAGVSLHDVGLAPGAQTGDYLVLISGSEVPVARFEVVGPRWTSPERPVAGIVAARVQPDGGVEVPAGPSTSGTLPASPRVAPRPGAGTALTEDAPREPAGGTGGVRPGEHRRRLFLEPIGMAGETNLRLCSLDAAGSALVAIRFGSRLMEHRVMLLPDGEAILRPADLGEGALELDALAIRRARLQTSRWTLDPGTVPGRIELSIQASGGPPGSGASAWLTVLVRPASGEAAPARLVVTAHDAGGEGERCRCLADPADGSRAGGLPPWSLHDNLGVPVAALPDGPIPPAPHPRDVPRDWDGSWPSVWSDWHADAAIVAGLVPHVPLMGDEDSGEEERGGRNLLRASPQSPDLARTLFGPGLDGPGTAPPETDRGAPSRAPGVTALWLPELEVDGASRRTIPVTWPPGRDRWVVHVMAITKEHGASFGSLLVRP